jgi:hypothetical protein
MERASASFSPFVDEFREDAHQGHSQRWRNSSRKKSQAKRIVFSAGVKARR